MGAYKRHFRYHHSHVPHAVFVVHQPHTPHPHVSADSKDSVAAEVPMKNKRARRSRTL